MTVRNPEEKRISYLPKVALLSGGAEMLCVNQTVNQTVTIRRTDTFAVVDQLKEEPRQQGLLAGAGAAEARIAFLGYPDGSLLCWDRGGWFGPQFRAARVPHPVIDLSSSADGSTVAVLCQPKGEDKKRPPRKVYLWRPRSDKAPVEYGEVGKNQEISLSPSGTRLVVMEPLGQGQIEEIAGKTVLAIFERGPEQNGVQATWVDDKHLVCLVWDRDDNPDLRLHLGLLSIDTQEWLWRFPVRSANSNPYHGASVSRRAGKIVSRT